MANLRRTRTIKRKAARRRPTRPFGRPRSRSRALDLEPAPPKRLLITDVVLRDGHQSLLATRMRPEVMLPIAQKLDSVGYLFLVGWGGAIIDLCLRFMQE